MINFKTRGKVPNNTVDKLLNNMLAVARFKKSIILGVLVENSLDDAPVFASLYSYLKRLAEYDMSYDDNSPAYSEWYDIYDNPMPARVRLIPFCGWSVKDDYYGNGCNDDHWLTVRKQIREQFIKEIKKVLAIN